MRYRTIVLAVALTLLSGASLVLADDKASFVETATAFVRMMSEGKYAEVFDLFDETMKQVVTREKVEETWKAIVDKMGRFRRMDEPTVSDYLQYKLVFVPCEWEHGQNAIKVVLDKKKQISGYFLVAVASRPPYLRANAIDEKNVTIGQGTWALPGTLALPKSKPIKAAVVLVHGSGPTDRDESIGLNKPFRDLALGLGSQGIATLRYDKRTFVHPRKLAVASITVKEEVEEDALLAIDSARACKELAGVPVYLLGHSLGGLLAPEMAAMAGDKLAGIILLAAPAREMIETILLDQFKYLRSLGQVSAGQLDQLSKQVESLRHRTLKPKENVLGGEATYWYDLDDRDGAVATGKAAALKCRILVLQGGRDYQSTTEDFTLWKSALAKHRDTTFRLFDNLNHLFAPGSGKATPAEYEGENHVDPTVIDAIARWIR